MNMTIGDLRHDLRNAKLEEFAPMVEVMAEMDLIEGKIFYGVPLYVSFGVKRSVAKVHGKSELLLMRGEDLKFSPTKEEWNSRV